VGLKTCVRILSLSSLKSRENKSNNLPVGGGVGGGVGPGVGGGVGPGVGEAYNQV
jgi:hypothetical protein